MASKKNSLRKTLTKDQRIAVYQKYNGHCAYCGCELEYKNMQVDHIESVCKAKFKKELRETLNDIDNYMPACRACNYYKKAASIEGFRRKLKTLHTRLRKIFIYKLAVKYGLIEEKPVKIVFYFEEH
ncbi:MAG: HNH endonuclease [Butyrivibrio sp.]|nr:HNH endonuclease [Butyrivibrio sp.]